MIAKLATLASAAAIASTSYAAYSGPSVILNEYNAVGSTKHLKETNFADSDKADTQFGRILGNGGNWFELVVLGDGTTGSTVNLQGATLSWVEEETNGTLTLSNDAFWANLTAGTILTFAENDVITSQAGTDIVNGSDTSLNFASGDNWAHIYAGDTSLISSFTTNDDGIFSVGNDSWNLTLTDASAATIFGPIGEDTGGATGGVNSKEVFKYEGQLTVPFDVVNYNDGSSSSFGQANVWSSGEFSQDFSSFIAVPEPASFLLLTLGSFALLRRKA
ncbi:PEP-CTERM sorting domain-containing protein [Planctomycetota bacterium]|nr:PEP-CTERM sorting domain-containing protein [Planctomycetota bacterium]